MTWNLCTYIFVCYGIKKPTKIKGIIHEIDFGSGNLENIDYKLKGKFGQSILKPFSIHIRFENGRQVDTDI